MIYSTGKPICELRTARMFENFILELEYQHLDAQGNAGVFIWGDALTAPGQPFVRAIEIQILDGRNTDNYTSHGDVFAIHGARMTPDRPHPGGWMRSLPSERRARPAGEWNHYRITAQNGTIKLAVNGKEVSGGYDISPRKGYIHLESEGGRVLYRNLRVKELPAASSLAPDQIAQADNGFVPLYTGVDFSGWQYPEGPRGPLGGEGLDDRVRRRRRGCGPNAQERDGVRRRRDHRRLALDEHARCQDLADLARRRPLDHRDASHDRSRARDEPDRVIERTAGGAPMLTRRGGRLSLVIDRQTVFENLAVGPAGGRGSLVLQPQEGAGRNRQPLRQALALTTTLRTTPGSPAAWHGEWTSSGPKIANMPARMVTNSLPGSKNATSRAAS